MGLTIESPHCDVKDFLVTIVDVEATLVFSAHITSQIPILQAKQQVVCTLVDLDELFLCSWAQLLILSRNFKVGPDTDRHSGRHTDTPHTVIGPEL